MSTEFSAITFIGIYLDKEQIESMATTIPAKTEEVKNFHKRTGEFLGMLTETITPAFDALVVGDNRYGDNSDADGSLAEGLDEIAQSVNKDFTSFVNQDQYGEHYGRFIGINLSDVGAIEAIDKIHLARQNAEDLRDAFNKYIKGDKLSAKKNPVKVQSILVVC